MKSDSAYYFIFDTNALYQKYEGVADFRAFSFNPNYNYTIDLINQLDIYNDVTILIPSVVWNEMEKQIVEKHDELLVKFKSTVTKKLFPEYSITENPMVDYPKYIKSSIEDYKSNLSDGINKVLELPIASSRRYDSIVDRAFNKIPPFEGKDKKSDKGFKDALLWESILEFASQHQNSKILYYSKDNAFGEYLLDEFNSRIKGSSISICKNESEVKSQLESWAKEIDKYSYNPITEYQENKELFDWLNSADFSIQIIDLDFGLAEKSRLISSTTANLKSIDSIECTNISEDSKEYYIEAVLEMDYTLKDSSNISDAINVGIMVDSYDDTVFSVSDIYRLDEEESEE